MRQVDTTPVTLIANPAAVLAILSSVGLTCFTLLYLPSVTQESPSVIGRRRTERVDLTPGFFLMRSGQSLRQRRVMGQNIKPAAARRFQFLFTPPPRGREATANRPVRGRQASKAVFYEGLPGLGMSPQEKISRGNASISMPRSPDCHPVMVIYYSAIWSDFQRQVVLVSLSQ
jgi:hypothetical protein